MEDFSVRSWVFRFCDCDDFPGCEGTVVSSRVRSFSLDQLRLATTPSVAVDDAPELRRKAEDSSDVEEQLELSSEPDTKPKVCIPFQNS